MTSTQIRAHHSHRPLTAIPVSIVVVAVAASAVNALVALAGVAVGLDSSLRGLQPMAYVFLTTIAAIGGAVGWHLVNHVSRRPSRVMRWLVPTFLLVSFVPDALVGAAEGGSEGWLYAGVLAVMHVTTITIAIATYRRLMPLTDAADSAAVATAA